MSRITTLNEDKGKAVSDLEALFIVLNKLLKDKLEQKPNAGITIAKGKSSERKFRYTDAEKAIKQLEDFFSIKGCFSIGVCQTCKQFNNRAHGNKAFGACRKSSETHHIWDSCPSHSKKGGGYGV